MDVSELIDGAWRDHATDAEGVWGRLAEGAALATEAGHLAQLAGLVVHVGGEHLGKWDEAIARLTDLTNHAAFEGEDDLGRSVWRSMAILHQCAGHDDERARCAEMGRSPDLPADSTEVRIHAIAASALSGQGRSEEAMAAFVRARDLAGYGPDAKDPAARALAITANNLACELEGNADRTAAESDLLREAAHVARTFWEIAGTWEQVKIAEYRLAMTHLALGEPETALAHAEQSREVAAANDSPDGGLFFPYEAISKAKHALGDAAGAKAARDEAAAKLDAIEDEGFRDYARGELGKLDALLAG